MGKGENAGNLHFLLFPQCFSLFPTQISVFESLLFCRLQMLLIWSRPKFCRFGKELNQFIYIDWETRFYNFYKSLSFLHPGNYTSTCTKCMCHMESSNVDTSFWESNSGPHVWETNTVLHENRHHPDLFFQVIISKYNSFLSKASDYFSHMYQRWEMKNRQKESLQQMGIKPATSRSWVRCFTYWALPGRAEGIDKCHGCHDKQIFKWLKAPDKPI